MCIHLYDSDIVQNIQNSQSKEHVYIGLVVFD